MPFGSQPKKDAGFVVGHKEIFSKKNANIKLSVEWAELPDASSKIKYVKNSSAYDAPLAIPQMLSGGRWVSNPEETAISPPVELFDGTNQKVLVQLFTSGQLIPQSIITDYADEYSQLKASSVNGFLKLSLDGSFGHSDYMSDLSVYLIEKATEANDNTFSVTPVEPYTPKVKSLYASYSAYCTNDLSDATEDTYEDREIKFFHIYPLAR